MKKISGNLLKRVLLNAKRLGDDLYTSKEIFSHTSDWPGDFVGRAVLALSSLHNALDGFEAEQFKIEKQLRDIFDNIDNYLNKDGYFGELFNDSYVDEQQISGNSWFLRGLVEYYKLSKDDKYLKQINKICDKYLLKISEFYNEYPVCSREFGGVGGHTNKETIGRWKVSTDIGCAFINLDGMTAVYELNKNEKLRIAIENVIEKFLTLDFVSLECQTHATLSCARGIFRFYKTTNESKYLKYVIDIFNKYLSLGMTLDYSNINWFNRKETWTEPCCIVDSMIVSKNLYLETKDPKYLQIFNKIYVNALRTFQRDNGGAGCSTCATDINSELKMFMYEAYFCCTMRLGEGLKEIVDFVSNVEGDTLVVNGPFDFEYNDGNNEIIIKNDIYNNGNIIVTTKKLSIIKAVKLFIAGQFVTFELKENSTISYDQKLEIKVINDLVFYGDMMLTIKENHDGDVYEHNGKKYSFIYDNSLFNEKTLSERIQYVK